MDGALRPSTFTRWRELDDGTVAAFNLLRPDVVLVERPTWDRLRAGGDSLSEDVLDPLLRALIVTTEIQDLEILQQARLELMARVATPRTLYLVLNRGCNFACSYCPIGSRPDDAGLMEPAMAIEAIDVWDRLQGHDLEPGEQRWVILYGGEPMLNWPAIEAAVTHVRRKFSSDDVVLMVCTNGTGVDAARSQFFADHDVHVTVGADGSSDTERLNKDGDETSGIAVRALEVLVLAGVTTFISAAMTAANVRDPDALHDFAIRSGVAGYGINFVRGEVHMDPQEAAAAAMAIAARADGPWEAQTSRRRRRFRERSFFETDCLAYGNQLVVNPDGTISNCGFAEPGVARLSDLSNRTMSDLLPAVGEWTRRLPLFNPDCDECDAKSICGGGCPSNSDALGLSIDPEPCELTKRMFEDLVLDEVARLRA